MDELDKLIAFDKLISEFQDKLASHPNLSTLWIDYLMLRKNNTNKLITQGKSTLKLMESVPDVNMDDMLLLIIFLKSQISD
jgi:hypothetical protein